MATIYPKEFFVRKKTQKASCFVLMPFDEKFKEVYDTIKEALESEDLNFSCNRADDFHQPHIIETILKGIAKSEYIIADLTESNPNVFYELGLAHCNKNIDKVILLTQDMKYVPFDLRQFRSIVYEQSIAGSKKLKNEILSTLKELDENNFRLNLKEEEKVQFTERLLGDNNYLYDLVFESPAIGNNAMKLQIHFKRLGADGSNVKLETQYLFLSDDKPEEKISNIPYFVTLIKAKNRAATISIDRQKRK
jgi:hypothetical protein